MHEGVWEVWEGDNWSDGYGKYRDRRGMGSIGKGPKHSTTHIRVPENRHPPSPPQARHRSPIGKIMEDVVYLCQGVYIVGFV